MGQQRRMRYFQQNQAEDEEHESSRASIQESKEKIIDACAQYIEKHAKQTITSYIVTYLLLEVFIVLVMLSKLQIFGEHYIEITLAPLIVNCLQIMFFSQLQLKSNIYKHMQTRVIETKILIIENVLAIIFMIGVSVLPRFEINGFKIPYSAACAPLIIILAQRFVWYKSLIRSFKTPIIFLKYVLQLLIINLILNICLKKDKYFSFDVIAMLWPCYGFIALSFIFFMGSLLLFFGSFCNSFQNQTDSELKLRIQNQHRVQRQKNINKNYTKIESDETFSSTISFWIFLNCSFLLIFSILGFIILLQDIKEEQIYIKGYYGILTLPVVIILYTFFYFNKICRWYYVKVLRPSIINELISIEQYELIKELERKRQSQTNLMNMFERELGGAAQGVDDIESAHSSAIQDLDSSHQSLNNFNKTESQLKKDMDELYKIKMLDSSSKELRQEVLSNVPLFLVKVSRSYYQRVEHYTQSFMDKITQKINHLDWKQHQLQQESDLLSIQTRRIKFQGFKKNKHSIYKQQKGSKLQLSHDSQRNRGLLKYLKSPDKQMEDRQVQQKLKQSQNEDVGQAILYDSEYKSTKSKIPSQNINELHFEFDKNVPYISDQLEINLKDDIFDRKQSTMSIHTENKPDRMCITNQLNCGNSSLNVNSQFVIDSTITESEKKNSQIKKQVRRTQSFNLNLLNQDKNDSDFVTQKILNNKILATLQQLNKKMGYVISESDQSKKSQNIDKKELISFKGQRQENEQSDDQSVLCMLCLERKSDAVILDCGHASICFFCAYKIYRTQNQCHLCRQNINRIIQVERNSNNSLKYQKVIGIVQKINKKFYYSDINKDQVSKFRKLGKQIEEGDLNTEYIDEGLNDIQLDLYIPHSAKLSQKNQNSERSNSI